MATLSVFSVDDQVFLRKALYSKTTKTLAEVNTSTSASDPNMKLFGHRGNHSTPKPRSIFRKSGSFGSPVLNPKAISELEENTIASDEPSERGSSGCGVSKGKHRVKFNEADNQVYPCPYHLDENCRLDSSTIWYHKEELHQFREDASDHGRAAKNRAEEAWARSIYQKYQTFCSVQSAHDMNVVYAAMSNASPLEAYFVGLEAWAIPSLKTARDQRRQKLIGRVKRIQSCTDISRSERAKRIRKVSHEIGRPGRLLAMHLAQMVQAQ